MTGAGEAEFFLGRGDGFGGDAEDALDEGDLGCDVFVVWHVGFVYWVEIVFNVYLVRFKPSRHLSSWNGIPLSVENSRQS